eukprot:Sspe_Gene.4173::Locus_1373_Transcript_1_1_Confidence_1.000_Length_3542::g.4173::m.4173
MSSPPMLVLQHHDEELEQHTSEGDDDDSTVEAFGDEFWARGSAEGDDVEPDFSTSVAARLADLDMLRQRCLMSPLDGKKASRLLPRRWDSTHGSLSLSRKSSAASVVTATDTESFMNFIDRIHKAKRGAVAREAAASLREYCESDDHGAALAACGWDRVVRLAGACDDNEVVAHLAAVMALACDHDSKYTMSLGGAHLLNSVVLPLAEHNEEVFGLVALHVAAAGPPASTTPLASTLVKVIARTTDQPLSTGQLLAMASLEALLVDDAVVGHIKRYLHELVEGCSRATDVVGLCVSTALLRQLLSEEVLVEGLCEAGCADTLAQLLERAATGGTACKDKRRDIRGAPWRGLDEKELLEQATNQCVEATAIIAQGGQSPPEGAHTLLAPLQRLVQGPTLPIESLELSLIAAERLCSQLSEDDEAQRCAVLGMVRVAMGRVEELQEGQGDDKVTKNSLSTAAVRCLHRLAATSSNKWGSLPPDTVLLLTDALPFLTTPDAVLAACRALEALATEVATSRRLLVEAPPPKGLSAVTQVAACDVTSPASRNAALGVLLQVCGSCGSADTERVVKHRVAETCTSLLRRLCGIKDVMRNTLAILAHIARHRNSRSHLCDIQLPALVMEVLRQATVDVRKRALLVLGCLAETQGGRETILQMDGLDEVFQSFYTAQHQRDSELIIASGYAMAALSLQSADVASTIANGAGLEAIELAGNESAGPLLSRNQRSLCVTQYPAVLDQKHERVDKIRELEEETTLLITQRGKLAAKAEDLEQGLRKVQAVASRAQGTLMEMGVLRMYYRRLHSKVVQRRAGLVLARGTNKGLRLWAWLKWTSWMVRRTSQRVRKASAAKSHAVVFVERGMRLLLLRHYYSLWCTAARIRRKLRQRRASVAVPASRLLEKKHEMMLLGRYFSRWCNTVTCSAKPRTRSVVSMLHAAVAVMRTKNDRTLAARYWRRWNAAVTRPSEVGAVEEELAELRRAYSEAAVQREAAEKQVEELEAVCHKTNDELEALRVERESVRRELSTMRTAWVDMEKKATKAKAEKRRASVALEAALEIARARQQRILRGAHELLSQQARAAMVRAVWDRWHRFILLRRRVHRKASTGSSSSHLPRRVSNTSISLHSDAGERPFPEKPEKPSPGPLRTDERRAKRNRRGSTDSTR